MLPRRHSAKKLFPILEGKITIKVGQAGMKFYKLQVRDNLQ